MGSLGQLIRKARGSASQKEFAAAIGTSQSLLSKYERNQLGHVPRAVIEKCFDKLDDFSETRDPGVETLVARIREELAEAESIDARLTIVRMLDFFRRTASERIPVKRTDQNRKRNPGRGDMR